MFPASTNGGGTIATPGPLDVCKTPAPPAPSPVPMPYPNIAMLNQAKGSSCSSKVKICGKKACTTKTEISMSSGDEPGTAGGGMVSNKFKGPAKFKKGSMKVKVQGSPLTHLTSLAGMNGTPNHNVPVAPQVAPSQVKVLVLG